MPKDIDIFTYSFPCQDISNQGKQKGFSKESKTRSGLLWEVERILNDAKKFKNLPKYLLLENVKAIINKKNIGVFNEWISRLNELGYETKWYLLNAANFGSCQNRERVFAISVLRTHKEKVKFEFPTFKEIKHSKKKIKTIINEKNINYQSKFNKYELLENDVISKNYIKKYLLKNYTSFQSENYVYDINYSGPTLTASGAMSRIKLYFGKNRIREMDAFESLKYMGFNDKDWKKINNTNLINPTKQIYLAGNSICVEVLEAIFKEFKF